MSRKTKLFIAGLTFPCLVLAFLLGSATADAEEVVAWRPIPPPPGAMLALRCFAYGDLGVVCHEMQPPAYMAPAPKKSCTAATP